MKLKDNVYFNTKHICQYQLDRTAKQAYDEGQNLLDQLCLPTKNAFGQDISPDNRVS